MRPCALLVLVSSVLACTSPPTDPVGPVPAALPNVFPPPEQLVDDRTITSIVDPLSGTTTPPAPVGPGSTPTVPAPAAPRPLEVRIDGGTLMYPAILWAAAPISITTFQPVSAEALKQALEFVGAASKEDLVAWRTTPLAFTIETPQPDGLATQWLLRPSKPLETSRWYRVRLAGTLQSKTSLPIGSEVISYVRGPEPLQVTDVSCGWPVCTVENRWTVSFNGTIDPLSLPGCIRTVPALDLGAMSVEGWSVAFTPKNAKVGSEYKLIVNDRCRNQSGDRMVASYEEKLRVEAPRAHLSLPRGTGYIVATKDTPLAIRVGASHTGRLTVGTTRLTRATLPAFLADNLESWGGFSFNKAAVERTMTINPTSEDPSGVPVPLGKVLEGDRGVVYLRVEAQHNGDDDEPPVRQALVQVTELGLSVKSGPEDSLVWVTSLVDQQPQAGVVIEALDGAGKTLWTRTTDERGMAVGPGRNEGGADDASGTRIVMASRGKDLAFIDLAEYANRSEAYEFGLPSAWDAHANALRGIVFTERGVYRTGETVHIKGYLRVERAGKLEKVDAASLRVTVTNPLGDRAVQSDVALGQVGDFELDVPLGETASLGSWQITVSAAGAAPDNAAPPVGPVATTDTTTDTMVRQATGALVSGSVSGAFRVEAYRPNTFEVKVNDLARVLTTPPKPGPRAAAAGGDTALPVASASVDSGDHLTAKVNGRYYYGAPMVAATARWWVNREDADFSPAGYEGFSFEIPSWTYDSWTPEGTSVASIATGEGTLDADGNLLIDADIGMLAPALTLGPQRLSLEVEVNDVDQQVVTGRAGMRIESADHYLGLRSSTSFAGVGESIDVETVALTPDGKPTADKEFTIRWIERTWTSERIVTAGSGLTWQSTMHENVLDQRALKSALTSVHTSFSPKTSGLYWIEVEGRDAKGRTMKARDAVWVWGDGASWAEGSEGHVELIAAQETWKVGENARFVVQSPFASAQALITVEANGIVYRDTRVLTGTAPLVEIPVSDAMMPNAYVSVVMIGVPTAKGSGEAEVRLGYAKMQVDTNARRIGVTVTPDQPSHLPGEPMRVSIALSDSAGNPMAGHVTFMAVDEGVLSLTGYHTPDPHKAFFAERSLAIVTSESRRQMWSSLVADDGMKSDWGGGGEGGEATNYRAAFATTAAFMPDVVVGTGGQTEVTFDLPDNLTAFRLMAVAASDDGRFGSGESKVEVKKPLLVRPGLPRFLSVGDRIDARAVIQALDPEAVGAVDVTLAIAGPIVIEGGDQRQVNASAKATPVSFSVRATEPGTATFAFTVTSADKKSRDAVRVEIPVNWPASKRSAVSAGVVGADKTRSATTLSIPDWVRDDIGGIDVTLTSTRLGELLPGLDYLLKYPYGCVEQTTGGTLPLLALMDLQSGFELPGIGKDQVLVRAQAGLDRLRTMQTWSGGFAYWPGETTPHPWGSVYAGMALVRASKMKGLDVPAAALERLTSYLRDILRDQAATAREEWHSEIDLVKPFAAYVLALAGTPEPAFHATLFDKRATLPDFAKLLLALAIDEAHGDQAMAATLLDEVVATVRVDGDQATLERKDQRYYYSTMDSDVRSMALLALALEAIRPKDALLPKVQQGLLAAREGGHWLSTQDNAFAVLALARTFLATEHPEASYTAKVEIDGQVWLTEAMRGDNVAPKTLHLPMYLARKANGKELVISREGDDAPIYFSLSFDYAPKEVPKKAIARGFTIERSYRIADGPRAGQLITGPGDKLSAGEMVRVDITVDAPDDRRYVAIDDPLPAGLEPITVDFATTRATLGALTASPETNEWEPEVFNHTEQRDDRVVLFADVMPKGRHTSTYLARATTTGAFIAPAARVHEMYHPDVYGQSNANELVIQ